VQLAPAVNDLHHKVVAIAECVEMRPASRAFRLGFIRNLVEQIFEVRHLSLRLYV
jgi:hypothetical protein